MIGPVRRATILTFSLMLVAGAGMSDARFVAQAASTGTLATRTWFVLHHDPSPPTGDTTAQAELVMDAVPPAATTLFNYDTNFDSLAGRRIRRSSNGGGNTTLARSANWRSEPFAVATPIDGTVILRIWCGVAGFPLDTRGMLTAYLTDLDPSTDGAVTFASATLDEADWQGGMAGWVEKRIMIPVDGYTLAAGRRLELELRVPFAAPSDMVIAYDTITHPSILGLP